MSGTSFICTKANGKPKIFDRAGFDAALDEFGDGEDFLLSVDAMGRKKTRAQEKFFHGPVLKAFAALGYRKQEAKEMLCLRFIPHEIRLLDGTIVLVPGHTSDLKVDEYNDLIESSMQLAAENDLYIESADEWRRNRRAA